MRTDGRQRDVHDRAVHDVQERHRAQQRQRELAASGRQERAVRRRYRCGHDVAHDPATSITGATSTPPPTRITGQSLASASAESMSSADTTEEATIRESLPPTSP